MEFVKLTPENLSNEHICCAISNNKDPQVASKKKWLEERLSEGLVFIKSAERGKCFIEYIPSENAWVPIDAENCYHINCFWVSGSFKGHGYSNELLDYCIRDAKAQGKNGITVISSPKKMPFLSDPKYLSHKGFEVVDNADPFYTLMYLKLNESAPLPKFKPQAKHPKIDGTGFTVFYTHGCPFTAKYVPVIQEVAKANGIEFNAIRLADKEQAQNAPVAWTNYAIFYNGEYVTNEIQSDKKFQAMIDRFCTKS